MHQVEGRPYCRGDLSSEVTVNQGSTVHQFERFSKCTHIKCLSVMPPYHVAAIGFAR